MKVHRLQWEFNLVYQELFVYGVIKHLWALKGSSCLDFLNGHCPYSIWSFSERLEMSDYVSAHNMLNMYTNNEIRRFCYNFVVVLLVP